MSSWEIVILVLMSVCFLSTTLLIISAVRALRRGDREYRDPYTTTVTYRVSSEPFWHLTDDGAYIELDDGGQLWYWSGKSDHTNGIST